MSSNYLFVKIPGDEMLASLPPETREVIMCQSNLTILNVNAAVCFHHKYVLLKRFHLQQRICCNPFDLLFSSKNGQILKKHHILRPSQASY